MTSSAKPSPRSNLSDFGLTDINSADACAALLRINAEMFVAAPARDRDSIETFEALAMGFLPKADHATLRDAARILVPCQDTPQSVLDFLLRHAPEESSIVSRRAATPIGLSDARYLATSSGRAHLASRPHLDIASVMQLLVLREAPVEDVLAANPDLPSSGVIFHELLRRAVERPALARILLQRPDLTAAHEACLYLAADRERRRLIRQRVARSMTPNPSVSSRLAEDDVATILAAASDGDGARVEQLLTQVFGFPHTAEWRILQMGRHLLLALALKALGFSSREAARVFLNLHPALSYPLSALRELMRETRDVSSPVALTLVETLLGVKGLRGNA